ncbi:hypothetical protein HF521_015253 [Silurus meridionalis]|uniref:Uncharacterized protein n=1 Tax=Silurus meridionalis TaxID=175797 RepID=A0A8T0A6Q2_SILME|nr:hypothetical protein HF521_015253 [Silurus meridionalis]
MYESSSVLRALRHASLLSSLVLRALRHASFPSSSVLRALRHASLPSSSVLRALRHASLPSSSVLRALRHASLLSSLVLRALRHASLSSSSVLRALRHASLPSSSVLRALRHASLPSSSVLQALRHDYTPQYSESLVQHRRWRKKKTIPKLLQQKIMLLKPWRPIWILGSYSTPVKLPEPSSRVGWSLTVPHRWIAVYGTTHGPSNSDVSGLQESWERLLSSGRPVTFQTIKELALNHNVLSGKWLMHLDTGFKVDHAWECIAKAIVDAKISVAKVSPRDPNSDSKHVICVYNENFTDEEQVMQLDAAIRTAGVKCPLTYKPDVYTYLGIYRKNRWKLCPTIYESKFDLECVPRRSHVFNRVTNLEVT